MERHVEKQLNHAKITERPIHGEERQRRAELRRQTSPRFFFTRSRSSTCYDPLGLFLACVAQKETSRRFLFFTRSRRFLLRVFLSIPVMRFVGHFLD